MVVITPKEVREARAFIHKRGLTSYDIAPKDFAQAAKRFGKSFSETLKLIASLKMKGQGAHPAEKTISALERIGK